MIIDNIPDWLIFALLGACMSGISQFLTKVKAEDKKGDFYFFIIYGITFSSLAFILGKIFTSGDMNNDYSELFIALMFGILNIAMLKSRFVSLKYITSSTYFINYRIFSSIFIIISGYLFFSESLTLNNFIGIILGIITFLLLIEKKEENEKIKDLKKGLFFLFIGIILISVFSTFEKYIAVKDLNIYSVLFYEGIFSVLFVMLLQIKDLKKEFIKKPKIKSIILYSFIGIVTVLTPIFSVKAFETGSIIIVYKIVSYSIFLTIFLSMIFYREKITIKKIIAFILAIISIGFFL